MRFDRRSNHFRSGPKVPIKWDKIEDFITLDLLKPVYNILTIAGSSQGFKHSAETIAKLKELSGENPPKYGTFHSEDSKKAISKSVKTDLDTFGHHNKGKTGELAPQYGIGGYLVYLYNADTIELVKYFPSINAAQKFLRVRFDTVKSNLDTKIPIKAPGGKAPGVLMTPGSLAARGESKVNTLLKNVF